jgi:P-type Cu+ transporter
MKTTLSLSAVGQATSLLFSISFVLCVLVGLIVPAHNMAALLQDLLSGFQWISWKSFFLGLIESYGYGWYVTLIWVPIYNVTVRRQKRTA